VSLVIGIDPGTRATGYAVLNQQGKRLVLVNSGTIRLDPTASLAGRLGQLYDRLDGVMQVDEPSSVAVEDIFNHRNTRSALLLGHARGVALAAAARRGLDVASYPPATVKRAVAGHGRADKQQIQQMVRVALRLERTPAQDEADAIAVAICHAMRQRSSLPAAVAGFAR
jgi:crossover junction endodeoxyribonuclease RuvC